MSKKAVFPFGTTSIPLLSLLYINKIKGEIKDELKKEIKDELTLELTRELSLRFSLRENYERDCLDHEYIQVLSCEE